MVGGAVDGTKVGLMLGLGVEGEVVVGGTLGIMLGVAVVGIIVGTEIGTRLGAVVGEAVGMSVETVTTFRTRLPSHSEI
jgi:hypothetical protein